MSNRFYQLLDEEGNSFAIKPITTLSSLQEQVSQIKIGAKLRIEIPMNREIQLIHMTVDKIETVDYEADK